MAVLVTKEAPDFTATALMPDGSFKSDFKLSALRGQKVVLFFYPLDFTFVCPSELIAFHNKANEFKKRDTQVIGCSVDSHFTHLAWSNTPVEQGGIGKAYELFGDELAPLLDELNEALESLAKIDARLAECVDLKFFCGFSFNEIAQLRDVSERTVQRDWDKARLLLNRFINDQEDQWQSA